MGIITGYFLNLRKSKYMKENIILNKSYSFALEVIKVYQHLSSDKKEFILSRQLLRSGTAIGALIREAEHAQSKKDFEYLSQRGK